MPSVRETIAHSIAGTPLERPLKAAVGTWDRRALERARRQQEQAALDAAGEFNAWRSAYDETSFAEQQAYYDGIAPVFPDQAHYTVDPVLSALDGVASVVEVGGWRGDLARDALAAHAGLRQWRNFDLCEWALDRPKFISPRYEGILLDDWPWKTELPQADAFVATHVIEHIRARELEQLAAQLGKYRVVHLEAPIAENTADERWENFVGTHILEIGWTQVENLLRAYGLGVARGGADWRTFAR